MKKLLYSSILITLISCLWTSCSYFRSEQSFEEIMKEPAASLNRTSGSMIDKETRFDSGVVLPNKTFLYSYTLVNYDQSELNVSGLKRDVEPVLKKRIIGDSEFQILRDNSATIKYKYSDKNNNTLFILTFTPNDYLISK